MVISPFRTVPLHALKVSLHHSPRQTKSSIRTKVPGTRIAGAAGTIVLNSRKGYRQTCRFCVASERSHRATALGATRHYPARASKLFDRRLRPRRRRAPAGNDSAALNSRPNKFKMSKILKSDPSLCKHAWRLRQPRQGKRHARPHG